MNREPRVALFDIETYPMLIWAWGTYDTNAIEVKSDSYMLSFSMKWLGKKQVKTFALPDFPNFRKDVTDDSALVKEMWKMMDEADIIIAQNGDNFDLKVANTRFLIHGLPPPSSARSVDTLKWARRLFKFANNKQDNITRQLGIKRKLAHTGKHLWLACGEGNHSHASRLAAFKKMARYNARDVVGLEGMYLRMRPFAPNHPNINLWTGKHGTACPVCQSPHIKRAGLHYLQTTKRQRFKCLDCGKKWCGDIVKEGTCADTARATPSRAASSRATIRTSRKTISRKTRSTGRGKRRASERN